MTVIDALIGVMLLINGLLGFKKGMIKMVTDIVAIIGGALVALANAHELSVWLTINSPFYIPAAEVVSFFVIWALVYFVVNQIGKIAHKILHVTIAGILNRMGGFVLGAFKGVIYAMPVLWVLLLLNVNEAKESISNKVIGPVIESWLPVDLFIEKDVDKLDPNKVRKELERLKLDNY